MKSSLKISVLLIMIAFVASSCGKYEDGPEVSLLPKSMRMVNTWKLDQKFKNSVEQEVTADEKDDYMDLQKDGSLDMTFVTSGISTTYSGTWEFAANNENVQIVYSGTVLGIPYTVDKEYSILRLKSNELWLSIVEGNDTYEYYYITK